MFSKFHLDGVKAYENNDFIEAKNQFIQAIFQNPKVPEPYYFLGKTLFLTEEREDAILYLKKFIALSQDPESKEKKAYGFDLLGQCYAAENKNNEALSSYQSALEIDPRCASACHNLGLLYMKQAQNELNSNLHRRLKLYKDAQIQLNKALEICSTNPMFLHSIASWYEQYIELLKLSITTENSWKDDINSSFKNAIQYYQEALIHCYSHDTAFKKIIIENLAECYAQYGHFHYKYKDFILAKNYYVLTLKIDPLHSSALNQIGMCLFKQGLYADARTKFKALLKFQDDKQDQADAWLNIAHCYRFEKDWVNAKGALSEAKKLSPSDTSINEEEAQLKLAYSQAALNVSSSTLFGLNPVDNQSVVASGSLQLN